MKASRIHNPASRMSARQQSVRHRVRRMPFKQAVRSAADALFHFTHSACSAKALWSARERVWLGNRTFMEWAVDDAEIDIPRIVAKTDGAPDTAGELHDAVHAELKGYWTEHLASLPSKSTPRWMPLP